MEVQVKHLLKDIEKIANDTFPKNIQVRSIVPNELWTILGDPTQLHQVLLNFCVNARDAMPNGGTLTIAAEERPSGRALRGPESRCACRRLFRPADYGLGHRHAAGDHREDFRSLFHHQGNRKGNRSWPLHFAGHCQKPRRVLSGSIANQGKAPPSKPTSPRRPSRQPKRRRKSPPNCPVATVNSFSLSMMRPTCARLHGRPRRSVWLQRHLSFGWRGEAVAIVARQGADIARRSHGHDDARDGRPGETIQVLLRLNPKLPIIAARADSPPMAASPRPPALA